MALTKSIPSPYGGADITYHNIANVDFDKTAQQVRVGLAGFVDAQARADDKLPQIRSNFTFPATSLPTMSALYSLIMAEELWSDAVSA